MILKFICTIRTYLIKLYIRIYLCCIYFLLSSTQSWFKECYQCYCVLLKTLKRSKHTMNNFRVIKCVVIPHATSCEGYDVFYPSVSQSVCQLVSRSVRQSCFFFSEQLLIFFSRSYALYRIRNWQNERYH